MTDRDIGRRLGFWPEGNSKDFNSRPFYPFFQKNEDEKILANLMNFFRAVASRWPIAWDATGRGAMLNKTNGYNGLMRFFRDCFLYETTVPAVVSEEAFRRILAKSILTDSDFTTERFPPGSSGASYLYKELLGQTGVNTI